MLFRSLLAAASCFLCYALFHVSAIPLEAIARAALALDFGKIAGMLAVWAVSFAILAVFAAAGWRMARARMMAEQYGFPAAGNDANKGVTSA